MRKKKSSLNYFRRKPYTPWKCVKHTSKVCKVISNKKIAPDHYVLAFKTPKTAKAAKPGQFFNIRVSDSYEPLLRRPFGAHNIYKDRIEILYKVVGKATAILALKKKGDLLDVLGPLGHGFEIASLPSVARNDSSTSAILVAGGHGVAPLVALAEELKANGVKLTVCIGAKTKKYVICENDFRNLGAEVRIATDDGSKGYKGLVRDLVDKELRALSLRASVASALHNSKNCIGLSYKNPSDFCREAISLRLPRLPSATSQPSGLLRRRYAPPRNDGYAATIYACGPMPMIKAVAKLAKDYRVPCQVSLEEYIACGIGTCLGCAVKTRVGYKLVCKDGPVFDSEEIIW